MRYSKMEVCERTQLGGTPLAISGMMEASERKMAEMDPNPRILFLMNEQLSRWQTVGARFITVGMGGYR